MTRAELITAMSRHFPQLSCDDVEMAAKTIVEAMIQSLCRGSRIEIRGFGSFYLNRRAPRTGRNPRTGEKVDVPATLVPHFKVGKNLMLRVNVQSVGTVPTETKACSSLEPDLPQKAPLRVLHA